jgi:hypothetical protein
MDVSSTLPLGHPQRSCYIAIKTHYDCIEVPEEYAADEVVGALRSVGLSVWVRSTLPSPNRLSFPTLFLVQMSHPANTIAVKGIVITQ